MAAPQRKFDAKDRPEADVEKGESGPEAGAERGPSTPGEAKGKILEFRKETSGRLDAAKSADESLTKRAAEMRGRMSPEEEQARREILTAHETLDADERKELDDLIARLEAETAETPAAAEQGMVMESALETSQRMTEEFKQQKAEAPAEAAPEAQKGLEDDIAALKGDMEKALAAGNTGAAKVYEQNIAQLEAQLGEKKITYAATESPKIFVDVSLAKEAKGPEKAPEKAAARETEKPRELNAEQAKKLEQRLLDLGMKDKEGKPLDAKAFVEKYPKSWEQRVTKVARDRVAEVEAKLKKFEGLGSIRALTGAGKTEKLILLEELENAAKEYGEMRAEFVGENARKMLHERSRIADTRAAELSKEKGISTKVYDAYKKLGEVNLTKTKWFGDSKFGKTRIGKMVGRAASMRTLASFALLGGGLAAGAGSAVGIGAILGRRVLSGMGASIGSYDLMRMRAERGAQKLEKTPAEMSMKELTMKMEKMEASAMMGGKRLAENGVYRSLKAELGARYAADGKERSIGDQESEMTNVKMSMLMDDTDRRLGDLKARNSRNDKVMKGAALALGIFVGSGALAKGFKSVKDLIWGGGGEGGPPVGPAPAETAKIVVNPEGDVRIETPGLEKPPEVPAAAGADLTEVRRGDGYTQIFARQIEADPAKYGYDAAKHGDASTWAAKMARKAARANDLLGTATDHRLRFDAASPGHVTLNADLSMKAENVKDYLYTDTDKIPKAIPAEVDQTPLSAEEIKARVAEVTKETGQVVDELVANADKTLAEAKAALDELRPPGEIPAEVPVEAPAEVLGPVFTENQVKLANALGGASAEDLRRIADAPSIADGKFWKVELPDGGVAEMAHGKDAQRAARLALQRMSEQVGPDKSMPPVELPAERPTGAALAEQMQRDFDATKAGVRGFENVKLPAADRIAAMTGLVEKGGMEVNGLKFGMIQGKLNFEVEGMGAVEVSDKNLDAITRLMKVMKNQQELAAMDQATFDAKVGPLIREVYGAEAAAAETVVAPRVEVQAQAAIVEQAASPELPKGALGAVHLGNGDLRFNYGPDGRVTGYSGSGELPSSGTGEKTLLQEHWRGVVGQKSYDLGKAWEGVRADVARIQQDKDLYDAMVRAGKGGTPEAQYLKTAYEGRMQVLEGKYGRELWKPPEPIKPPIETGDINGVRFEGGQVRFAHDADGRVIGVSIENQMGEADLQGLNGMMQEGWARSVANKGEVLAGARDIFSKRKALEALSMAGKTDSAEAKFLQRSIEEKMNRIEGKYGNVYK